MQRPQILAPLDDAAAAGEQLSALFGKAGGLGGFLRAEAVLALGGEDVGDAAAVGLDDLLVEVDELLPSFSANARPTVDFPLEGIPMRATLSISRRSAAVMRPISCRVVELPAEEVFGGVHGLAPPASRGRPQPPGPRPLRPGG